MTTQDDAEIIAASAEGLGLAPANEACYTAYNMAKTNTRLAIPIGRHYDGRTRRFGAKDTIIVSLETMLFSDIACTVCGDLIPYNRALTAQTLNPDGKPEYCSDRCMKTHHMRAYRSGVNERKAAKRSKTTRSKKAA